MSRKIQKILRFRNALIENQQRRRWNTKLILSFLRTNTAPGFAYSWASSLAAKYVKRSHRANHQGCECMKSQAAEAHTPNETNLRPRLSWRKTPKQNTFVEIQHLQRTNVKALARENPEARSPSPSNQTWPYNHFVPFRPNSQSSRARPWHGADPMKSAQ